MGSHERRMNILPTNFEEKDWRNQIVCKFFLVIIKISKFNRYSLGKCFLLAALLLSTWDNSSWSDHCHRQFL